MNEITRIRQWLAGYTGSLPIQELKVDYFSPHPDNGGINPSGLVEISRDTDIMGNITVKNQLNFELRFVLLKSPGDDEGATDNADLLMDFQRWVQEQSIRRLTPFFGDDQAEETIKAQNGAFVGYCSEGTALYTVQLSINFIKYYEVN